MSVPVLFAAMYVLGAAFAVGLGPRRDPLLACAIAFPLGLALTALIGLALVTIGSPVTHATLGFAGTLALAGSCVAAARRDAVDRRALLLGALWLAVLLAAAWWASTYTTDIACASRACVANRRLAHHDARVLLAISHVAQARDMELEKLWGKLPKTGLFTMVIHATAGVAGAHDVKGLSPVLGLSMVALFAVAAWRLIGLAGMKPPWLAVVVVLFTAAVTGALFKAHELYYLDRYLFTATYVLGFAASWGTAEIRREPSALWPAMVCLAAVALQTYTSAYAAAVYLGMALFATRLPRCAIAWPLASYTIGLLLWLGVPAGEDRYSGPADEAIAAVAGLFALWLVLGGRRLRQIRPVILALLLVACAGWFAWSWWSHPKWTPRLFLVVYVPVALLYVGVLLARGRSREPFRRAGENRIGGLAGWRHREPADQQPEPAGALTPFGGRLRAAGLCFVVLVAGILVVNVRTLVRNQRALGFRYQLSAHDYYDHVRAAQVMVPSKNNAR